VARSVLHAPSDVVMAEESQHAEPHPKGTLAMILLYLVMISVLWIDVYLTLWFPRGAT
jgi:hypothetical protein